MPGNQPMGNFSQITIQYKPDSAASNQLGHPTRLEPATRLAKPGYSAREHKMSSYQITVNGNTYVVTVKGILNNIAIVDVDGWEFHVDIGGKSNQTINTANLIEKAQPKPASVEPVVQKDSGKKRTSVLDLTAPKQTTDFQYSGKGLITAHLPGLITEILVKPGDKVNNGDLVMKMEAMKMVNEIRAKNSGTVKEILVSLHQNVLENQPLLIIE